jgi:hypothetical protein
LDTTIAHPREVFKPAILINAASIIVAHNHPSGDPSPARTMANSPDGSGRPETCSAFPCWITSSSAWTVDSFRSSPTVALTRHHKEDPVIVKIILSEKGTPPGKLADAELHFTEGPLDGLKLIGFGVWERKGGSGRNVTFPSRQYSVNGERRSFSLLRPVTDTAAQNRVRDLILEAYAEHEHASA